MLLLLALSWATIKKDQHNRRKPRKEKATEQFKPRAEKVYVLASPWHESTTSELRGALIVVAAEVHDAFARVLR
jgi:hypothetical protein